MGAMSVSTSSVKALNFVTCCSLTSVGVSGAV